MTRLNNSHTTEKHPPLTPIISRRRARVCARVRERESEHERPIWTWLKWTHDQKAQICSHQTKTASIWLGLTSRIWPSGEVPWDVCVFRLHRRSSQTGYVINCVGLCLFVSDPVKRTALWLPLASICCSKTPLFPSVVTSSSPDTTCGLCPLIPEWSFVPKSISHRDAFHTSNFRHNIHL